MDFTELGELHEYLEEHAIEYKYHHQIANLFQKIRDEKNRAGQTDDAEKAQWEMNCFNLRARSGGLSSMYSGTDENGKPWEYPDISKLSQKELEYIVRRLEGTYNPVLRARYAHILWLSPKKHKTYAEIAVDSYLELVRLYEGKDKTAPQDQYGLDALHSIETASSLAFWVDYKVKDVRDGMARLVKQFNPESSSAFAMRATLIRHMLEGKKKFPPECFDGFPEVCRSLGQRLFDEGKYHQAIDIFKVGEKVDAKLSMTTFEWNRGIAESFEGLISQRGEGDPARVSFCESAVEYYRILGDEAKIKELEEKYKELKEKQRYQQFSHEIDLSPIINACKEAAEKVCEETTETIISLLISGQDLLPTYEHTRENAEKQSNVMLVIAPVSVKDSRGHTAEWFATDDEKKYFKILEQYNLAIQLEKQFLINEILVKAVQKDKLNIHLLMSFLAKNSWYGKNINKSTPSGTVVYNWLNMIAPGLNDYFNQLKAHIGEPSYSPNFVLAMDSLTTKVEGLVRDICSFSGVTTFHQAKDTQGRPIVREKDINWLLRDEPVTRLFSQDDLLFFKYVLVEKAGLNLRHKIAHCLIDFADYNMTFMHLILLLLLRLGKYDFVTPEKVVEEKVETLQ